MRFKVLSIVVLLASVATVRPQEGPQSPAPFGSSSAVDVQGVRNYLLGPGDVVDVRVFGQADLNSTAEVDSDGNLSSLPFLETQVRVVGGREKKKKKDMLVSFKKCLKSPQVSVRIIERKSGRPATVFGAVRQSQRIQMMRKIRLNEIMAASGGF